MSEPFEAVREILRRVRYDCAASPFGEERIECLRKQAETEIGRATELLTCSCHDCAEAHVESPFSRPPLVSHERWCDGFGVPVVKGQRCGHFKAKGDDDGDDAEL